MRFLMVCVTMALPTAMCLGATESPSAIAEKVDYRGFDAIHMGNGIVDLWVVPDIGGRILQIECRGHQYLYVNDALTGTVMPQVDENGDELPWNNYGGDKLWPGPQGSDDGDHWQGPPDPVLDGCRYDAEIVDAGGDEAVIRLTSPAASDYWGIQFVRELTLRVGEARVISTTTMRNIVDRDVRWAIWEVTQHDAGQDTPPFYNDSLMAYVPASPDTRHPRGYWVMFGRRQNQAFSRPTPDDFIRVQFNREVGKIGVDSDAGWLAVMNGTAGMAFTQVFAYESGREYTDDGSSVEFWINGVGEFVHLGENITIEGNVDVVPPLMESEVLGPRVMLRPGEEYTQRVVLGLGSGAGEPAWATEWGIVLRPAQATADGDVVEITADVTPHVGGRIAVVARNNEGAEIARRWLAVSPPGERTHVSLNLVAPSAVEVEMVLGDGQGAEVGKLISIPVDR